MIAVIFEVAPTEGLRNDYRLRIAEVVRDYGLFDRAQEPKASKALHSTSIKKDDKT